MAGNAPGKSSYANITGKPCGKKVNVCTLFTPEGNGIDVVVLVDSIHAISERFTNIAHGFFLGNKVAYPIIANYVRNTWEPIKGRCQYYSSLVKLFGVPVTAFSEDGLSAIATKLRTPLMLDSSTSYMCSSCKVFGHIHEECLKNTSVVEKKTVKKPSQTSRGVLKGVEPTIEVSNSNPFDVLNLVNNDVKFGTNGRNSNLICDGKLKLLDNDGNPLVPMGIIESDSEVEVVFDKTANLMISKSGKYVSDKREEEIDGLMFLSQL
nr:hypothetical protein [Tanacetum cinerariifolium]